MHIAQQPYFSFCTEFSEAKNTGYETPLKEKDMGKTLIRNPNSKMNELLKTASEGNYQSRIVKLSASASKKWDGSVVRDTQDETLEERITLGQTPNENSVPPATIAEFKKNLHMIDLISRMLDVERHSKGSYDGQTGTLANCSGEKFPNAHLIQI